MNRSHAQKTLLILMIVVMGLVLVSCGSTDEQEVPPLPEQVEEGLLPVFTMEELAEYDGKEERPAYVAIDGLVYDVTEVEAWNEGTHNGNEAGQELTEALQEESPHGESVLEDLPVAGILEE